MGSIRFCFTILAEAIGVPPLICSGAIGAGPFMDMNKISWQIDNEKVISDVGAASSREVKFLG